MMHWTHLYHENVSRYGQRPGQAMWNAWEEYRPQLVQKYRATDLDPFYDDSKLGAFVAACIGDLVEELVKKEIK